MIAAPLVVMVGAPAPQRVVTVEDTRITESSGLAVSPSDPQVAWTVNDSGDSARAFAVSLTTGRTVAVLTERTDARDCEAMTAGRDPRGRAVLWIGDIGDNRADRTSVVLRLVPEPVPIRSDTVTPVSLRVRYPGGPADAETLIWTPAGRLLIVTKGLFGSVVYQVPPAAVRTALAGRSVTTPALARKVGTVDQVLVTDGVALPDGRLVLRDYLGATIYAPAAYDGRALRALSRLALPGQRQGETMALLPGAKAVLVGSEGVRQPLWRVGLPGGPVVAQRSSSPTATARAGHPHRDRALGLSLLGAAAVLLAAVAAYVRRRLGRVRH